MGLGLEFFPGLVQIDSLGAAGQGLAVVADGNHLHTQNPGIERTGGVKVFDGQHQVIERDNFHAMALYFVVIHRELGDGVSSRMGDPAGRPYLHGLRGMCVGIESMDGKLTSPYIFHYSQILSRIPINRTLFERILKISFS
jgi:hypothetical protein